MGWDCSSFCMPPTRAFLYLHDHSLSVYVYMFCSFLWVVWTGMRRNLLFTTKAKESELHFLHGHWHALPGLYTCISSLTCRHLFCCWPLTFYLSSSPAVQWPLPAWRQAAVYRCSSGWCACGPGGVLPTSSLVLTPMFLDRNASWLPTLVGLFSLFWRGPRRCGRAAALYLLPLPTSVPYLSCSTIYRAALRSIARGRSTGCLFYLSTRHFWDNLRVNRADVCLQPGGGQGSGCALPSYLPYNNRQKNASAPAA